jgi:molybdate transport system substrate-binding protein
MRFKTPGLMLGLLITYGIAQGSVQAAEITVLAGMGNVSGIRDLAPAFERATGHKVVVRFVATADLPGVIDSNAPADVLTAGPEAIDGFISKGKVAAGTRVDFGKAGVGVSVKAGPILATSKRSSAPCSTPSRSAIRTAARETSPPR